VYCVSRTKFYLYQANYVSLLGNPFYGYVFAISLVHLMPTRSVTNAVRMQNN